MFEITSRDISDALDRIKASLPSEPITEQTLNIFLKQYSMEAFNQAQMNVCIRDIKKYGRFDSEFIVHRSSSVPYIEQVLTFKARYSPILRRSRKIFAGHYALPFLKLDPDFKPISPEKLGFSAVEPAGTFAGIPVYSCNILSHDTREIYFETDDKIEIVKIIEE